MKRLLLFLISLFFTACAHNPGTNSGLSNTVVSGEVVMYSQNTF